MRPGTYFLGYDLGTSGVKAVAVDSKGRPLASDFQRYPSYSPVAGAHEQNPRDWWRAFVRATRRTLRKGRLHSNRVGGISCGVQGLGFIPVDANVRPLAPCMTWLDSRATKEAGIMCAETGRDLSAKDVPVKCLWLKRHEPRVFREAFKFIDCGGYLLAKLSGNLVLPIENALWFGYGGKKEWRFERYGLTADRVATPIPATGIAGLTTETAGRELRLSEGVPVIAGGSDVATAAIGSGALRSGSAHVYLGSSSWFCVTSSKKTRFAEGKIPSGGLFAINPMGRWFLAGESESACACLDWLAQQIYPARMSERQRYAQLDSLAGQAPTGSGNLIFTPWMKGEKAPITDDSARGAFMGLTFNHGRAHLVRSVMEGVAFNIGWVRDQMKNQHVPITRRPLRAIGGGFNSRLWTQILADVLGQEIEVVKWPQYAGAIGAALIAALGTGLYTNLDDLDRLLPVSFRTRPRKQFSRIYQQLLRNFKESYPEELAKIYHEWDSNQDSAT